jgi:4-diphosphocytidyl-2-C-methyl-D-erythritol kinase
MSLHRALAPAKINLGLFLGPTREADGRHQLVSVMQSISLADELTLELAPAGSSEDQVLCPALPGPSHENLAAVALEAFRRSTGWDAPPLLLSIEKRIPVAAGLGGGSADAAAALRLARHMSGLGDEELLLELARELGADVPAQVSPGRWLATGAGERLEALPDPRGPLVVVVLPSTFALSTAAVYAEADRLGEGRSGEELERLGAELAAALAHGEPLPGPMELLHNDLQRPALSLCPETADALRRVGEAGAEMALVSGSGPTVLGLFRGSSEEQQQAREVLQGIEPMPIWATPVGAVFGGAVTL